MWHSRTNQTLVNQRSSSDHNMMRADGSCMSKSAEKQQREAMSGNIKSLQIVSEISSPGDLQKCYYQLGNTGREGENYQPSTVWVVFFLILPHLINDENHCLKHLLFLISLFLQWKSIDQIFSRTFSLSQVKWGKK